MSSITVQSGSFLLCGVGSHVCALQLDHVVETMRMLAIKPLAGTPEFILGVSIVRGEPVPVVDAALLLGIEQAVPTRLVSVNFDQRRVALAVGTVLGIQAIGEEALHALPPLLGGASGDAIAALGALDSELLIVLRHARLVSDSVWAIFDVARSA